jgi:hypothetical protein
MGNVAYILQNIKSICQNFANSFNFFHTNGEIAAVAGDEMEKNGGNIPDFTRLLQKIKKKLKKMQIFA